MTNQKQRVNLTLALLLGIASLFVGLLVFQHLHTAKKIDVSQFHGTYLASPRTIKPFSFMGTDNQNFSNASLKGHWTVLFFGFTSCGYMCPTTLAELAKMHKILEEKGVRNLPQVVMLSIDPERDTLEKLSSYMQAFHPSFYGARGEEKDIQLIAREMGIAYAKVYSKENEGSQNYEVEHSGALMLFNPQGELNAFFTTPHHADLLAKDYMQLQ